MKLRFIDFLKNTTLNEMAIERRVAISVSESQFNSVITHLLKVYIGRPKVSSSRRRMGETNKWIFE